MESLVMKHLIPKTMTAVPVLALALAVGGCGSSSSSDDTMPPEPTPAQKQATCESGGGRWNADMTCTSAEMLKAERAKMQRDAINMAIEEADDAVAMVEDDSTASEVSAADAAVMAARDAIMAAADVPAEEKAAHTRTVDTLADELADAKMKRQMAMDDAQKAEDRAMMATAMKLYAGISAPTATDATPEATIRFAAYNTGDDAIDVQNGVATADAQELSEDKKTMDADNHGWAGKKYMASGDDVDGMYEAVVYSNVGEPTQGKKFGGAAADDEFQYALTNGMVTVDTTNAPEQMRVASSMFDQSAGVKTFKLPANNVAVMVPGSYHGVSGTYSCTPTGDTICASRVAADGFELGTVASATDNTFTVGTTGWTFKPTDANARVTDSPDSDYASYGWWIHKSEDGMYTASAFADTKGTVDAAAGITALQGTARYMGGAAGKYALYSATGGTNDAGHFTARATLEADFSKNISATGITGTIDQFIGADGEMRNWEVELMGSAISADGLIRALNADGTTAPVAGDAGAMTKWTIGDNAAAAAGQWSGTLMDNGDDGVPKVGTGTFHSMFGSDGKMVGAFGVTKE